MHVDVGHSVPFLKVILFSNKLFVKIKSNCVWMEIECGLLCGVVLKLPFELNQVDYSLIISNCTIVATADVCFNQACAGSGAATLLLISLCTVMELVGNQSGSHFFFSLNFRLFRRGLFSGLSSGDSRRACLSPAPQTLMSPVAVGRELECRGAASRLKPELPWLWLGSMLLEAPDVQTHSAANLGLRRHMALLCQVMEEHVHCGLWRPATW